MFHVEQRVEMCSTWNIVSRCVPRGTNSKGALNFAWVTGQNMPFCLAVQSIAAVNNLGFCVQGLGYVFHVEHMSVLQRRECSTWNTFLVQPPKAGRLR